MKYKSNTENIIKGTVVVYIERIIMIISQFFISLLLVRILSETDYGLYKIVTSVLAIITYFTSFGLEITLTRYTPEFLSQHNEVFVKKLFKSVVIIRIMTILVVFVIVFFLREKFPYLLNAHKIFDNYIFLILPYIFFSLINNLIGRALLTGYYQRYLVGYVDSISKLFTLVFILYIFFFKKGLFAVIFVLLLASFLEFLIYFPLSFKAIKKLKKINNEIDKKFPRKRIIKFSLYNMLYTQGQYFREYSIDNIIISHYLNPFYVGYYGVATLLPEFIRKFAPGRMLQGVIMPLLVGKYEKSKKYNHIQFAYLLLQKFNLLIFLPIILILFFTSDNLLPILFGANYANSVLSAKLLLGFSMFHIITYPYYLIFNVIDKPQVIFYSCFFGILNLIFNILLVPYFGIEGAAFSTGSIGFLIFIYFHTVILVKYKIKLNFPFLEVFKLFILVIPTLLFVVLFEYKLNLTYHLILGILLTAYLLLIRPINYFSSMEKELLFKKLGNKKLFKILI
jgi:O-antigen/teichoic acid export membrane protein